MTEKRYTRKLPDPETSMTTAFVENFSLLKKFLSRFFSERQDIEDVAQEAFLRAFVAEQRKNIEQPKAYLFRIAKNLALTKLTNKSKQIAYYIAESGNYYAKDTDEYLELACVPSAEIEVEALELLGNYCEAVAALPEKCRQVFLLRKVHGLSHQEIATRMSLSISSVEKYLLKGILDCKTFMDKKGSPTVVANNRTMKLGSSRSGRQ